VTNLRPPHPDALFVALALAPNTYSRNKFFDMFTQKVLFTARRRAELIRGIVRDLSGPPPEVPGGQPPQILEETRTHDGLRLVYRMPDLEYRRTALLSPLEAAVLEYSLSRVGVRTLAPESESQIRKALSGFGQELELSTP